MTRPFTWRRLCAQCAIGLILFVVANVYTFETSYFFARERAYWAQMSDIATHKNVRVIFAGDSHFGVPLNDYLNINRNGPAYSVASGGDSLRECFAKVRYVLESTPTVDTLILTADPHMFGSGRINSSNRSFADRYFIEAWDRSGVQHNLWSAMLQQVPLFNEDFLQYFRKELNSIATHAPSHARAEGDPLAWSRLTEAERMKAAVATGQGDHAGVGTLQQPYMWYGRILDLARAHHVKVIGVRFPVHPGYAAGISSFQVSQLNSYMLSHGMAQIIDLRTALTDPKYFQDEDHVSVIGAAPVLTILEQKLQRPLR